MEAKLGKLANLLEEQDESKVECIEEVSATCSGGKSKKHYQSRLREFEENEQYQSLGKLKDPQSVKAALAIRICDLGKLLETVNEELAVVEDDQERESLLTEIWDLELSIEETKGKLERAERSIIQDSNELEEKISENFSRGAI